MAKIRLNGDCDFGPFYVLASSKPVQTAGLDTTHCRRITSLSRPKRSQGKFSFLGLARNDKTTIRQERPPRLTEHPCLRLYKIWKLPWTLGKREEP
jgi:hypothetical protein